MIASLLQPKILSVTHSESVLSERGLHEQRVQYTSTVTFADGSETTVTNSYTQLGTGLNRWDEQRGEFVPASAEIEIINGAGVIQNAQYKAILSQAANDPDGLMDLLTPGGDRLVTQPIGIALTESDTGKSVFLAELRDSQAILLEPQLLVYPNAFDQFKASIAIRSHLHGLESDVILQERLDRALLADFGINPATARIEVWHRVLAKPDVAIQENQVQRRDGGQEPDHTIFLNEMKIGCGTAFFLDLPDRPLSTDDEIAVVKEWTTIAGLDFLIESVPFSEVEEALTALRAPAQARRPDKALLNEAFARAQNERQNMRAAGKPVRSTPVSIAAYRRDNDDRVKRASKTEDQDPVTLIAKVPAENLSARLRGFVIDFLIVLTNQSNFTFQSDTTYWVTSVVDLNGTTTLEGGAVIKFTNYTASVEPAININGDFVCKTAPYNPAIFTSEDDNTVGETINTSSGVPLTNTYYAEFNLRFAWNSTNTLNIHDIHSRYGHVGVHFNRAGSPINNLWNIQVYNCDRGIESWGGHLNIRNALIHKTRYALNPSGTPKTFVAEHLTVNSSEQLFSMIGTNCWLYLTNSLLCSITTTNTTNVLYGSTITVTPSAFQTVGRGNHYLSDDTYRNAGTTNISAEAQSILSQATTYPPIHLTSDFTADTTLSPVVQRDIVAPDLGYHYVPLDYLIGGLNVTNATLSLTNGVAIALYDRTGITLRDGSDFRSTGRPEALNTLVRYQTVQEDPSTLLGSTNSVMSLIGVTASNSNPQVQVQFTRANFLANGFTTRFFVFGYYDAELISDFSIRDSQFVNSYHFHRAQVDPAGAGITFFNNRFHRSSIIFYQTNTAGFYDFPLSFRNNLIRGAGATFYYGTAGTTWTVRENVFDKATQWGTVGAFDADYNAYLSAPPGLGGMSNITLVATDFVTGPLGDYYYPATGTNLASLVNKGSRTAAAAGLAQHTTSGSKDTNTVDIGFHYVSATADGIPYDTDPDGVPDYLEDRNGDGDLDSGETDLSSGSDAGLKVLITEPKANSNLP